MAEEKIKKVTLGLVLSWIIGVIFILSGLGALFSLQLISALVLFIMATVLLPPFNKFISTKFKFELSKGIKAVVIIVGFIIIGIFSGTEELSTKETVTQPEIIQEKPKEIAVVSKSFNDFYILCDRDATELQKKEVFNNKFKDRYVKWTGEVVSISETFFSGKPELEVIHCPTLIKWNDMTITITMRSDQKEKLLKYKEGDSIAYRAKLTSISDIFGVSATDGEVIE